MECPLGLDKSRELAVGYTAQSLDACAQAEFERHFRSCEICAAAVAEQQAVWDALDAWAPIEVSPGFDPALRARIASEQQSWWRGRVPVWWQRTWRPAVPVVAAGIALGLAVWINRPQEVEVAAPSESSAQVSSQPAGQMESLEHALDDMEMLGQWSAAPAPDTSLKSPI